ncbi:MAG: M4 family metallopeptidase, partial [Candidatus Hydrogenedentota bacterium]
MRSSTTAFRVFFVTVLGAWTAIAQGAKADVDDIGALLKTVTPGASGDLQLSQTAAGFVRFAAAPEGGRFETPASLAKSAFDSGSTAEAFVNAHRAAFSDGGARVAFRAARVWEANGKHFIRLDQTYRGVKVFGADLVIEMDVNGGVLSVLSHVMQDTAALDSGDVSVSPVITALAAQSIAVNHTSDEIGAGAATLSASEPELAIYRPAVVGNLGATRLVWRAEVSSAIGDPVRQQIFVDAHSGEIALSFTLIYDIKDRKIYDARNQFVIRENFVRGESAPATGDEDVDNAYEFLGNTYDFYQGSHGRDSIDGAGGTMFATVHYGTLPDAFWNGTDMVFSDFFMADDVAGHELTHGVTQFESGLIYLNESGAINESFSDVWGEFIDLTARTGTSGEDTPAVRWFVAEDSIVGAIRNMADPTQFGDPDRYKSPLFFRGTGDNGGIHSNSGINNKLCYLLTDGGTFNGFTIGGLGIERTADLYYAVQTGVLSRSATYYDLFDALGRSAQTLEFSEAELTSLNDAMAAVEIIPPLEVKPFRGFRALPAETQSGAAVITLQWARESGVTIRSINRSDDSFPLTQSDGDILETDAAQVAANYVIDEDVDRRTEYFYTIFTGGTFGSGRSFARATAGAGIPQILSEDLFGQDVGADLGFTQILFSPVVDYTAQNASGRAADYLDYSNFTASITRGVSGLPVSRSGGEGNAYSLLLPDDGLRAISLGGASFPYFGGTYSTVYVGANGYVDFEDTSLLPRAVVPLLSNHMDRVRISLLFSDLNPAAGGDVWAKFLGDRVAITYESVPAYTSSGPFPQLTTAQLELFYSGHIRMTYSRIGIEGAIAGISDGRGVPRDLSELLPGTPSEVEFADLSDAPAGDPETLTFWPPVPNQVVTAGESVEFTVRAVAPEGIPRLAAEWTRGGAVPFTDRGDGTGSFLWRTATSDSGTVVVTILGSLPGGAKASLRIPIFVADARLLPEAHDLLLDAGEDGGGSGESRTVNTSAGLTTDYTYFHPNAGSAGNAEGPTALLWYRNGEFMSTLAGSNAVPAELTSAGDEWFFAVRPITVAGVIGNIATSPRVTIEDD